MLSRPEGQLPDAGNPKIVSPVEAGHRSVQIQVLLSIDGELVGTVVRNIDGFSEGVVHCEGQAAR